MITRPQESYRLWRVVVCDLETSKEEAKSPLKGCEYKPTKGCDAEIKKNSLTHTLIHLLCLYLTHLVNRASINCLIHTTSHLVTK